MRAWSVTDEPAHRLDVRVVALVEGTSDQVAVESLAARLGRHLPSEGISVVAMGGATNIGRFLERFGPSGLDVRLAGLYDAGEERAIRRALESNGLGADPGRIGMESRGFYACDPDLEGELIRALGVEAVEQVIDAHGELRSFRTLQAQPAQREWSVEAQLRRFMGTRSGRKAAYARLLIEALDLAMVPRAARASARSPLTQAASPVSRMGLLSAG